MGLNLTMEELDQYALILGYEKENWPLKYLGLPLERSPKSLDFWKPVLETMTKRLSSWKKNYISLGSKITLIRTTLSDLPTYYLSIFKALVRLIKFIKKLQRDFLWEPSDSRKDHLIK